MRVHDRFSHLHLAIGLIVMLSVLQGCKKPKWRGHDPSASHAVPTASTPPSPQPVRDPVLPLHQRTYSIAVDGSMVHAGTTAGVVSWDFTDTKKPQRLASLVLRDSVQHLTMIPDSKLIAVSTGPTGLAFVDAQSVRDKKLVLINEHPWGEESKGGCHAVWRLLPSKPGFGYLACGAGGVARVDFSKEANPRVDRRAPIDGTVRDVGLLDGGATKVLAAAGTRGVTVVDFAGPKPAAIATLDVGGEARALEVQNGLAYVAAGEAGLVVVDVTAVRAPAIVGRLQPKMSDMARGIAISGSHAFLCLGDSGLSVVDLADPTAPKEVGRFNPKRALNRVTVRGQKLFAANDADGVTILDVETPQNPIRVYPLED